MGYKGSLRKSNGKHTLDPAYRPLPAVVAPWALMGQMAFNDIQARLDQPGWPPRRIYVPGMLVDPPNTAHNTNPVAVQV